MRRHVCWYVCFSPEWTVIKFPNEIPYKTKLSSWFNYGACDFNITPVLMWGSNKTCQVSLENQPLNYKECTSINLVWVWYAYVQSDPETRVHGATGSITSICLWQWVSVKTVEDGRPQGCSSWLSALRRKACRFLLVSAYQLVAMMSPNSYCVHHKTNNTWNFIFSMDTHSSWHKLTVANG